MRTSVISSGGGVIPKLNTLSKMAQNNFRKIFSNQDELDQPENTGILGKYFLFKENYILRT